MVWQLLGIILTMFVIKKKVFNLNPWITNIIYEISKIVTIINFVTENIKQLTDSYYNVY